MTYKEIQARLKAKGITQAELARLANVTQPTISQFIRRRFKSERLAKLINTKLGCEELR